MANGEDRWSAHTLLATIATVIHSSNAVSTAAFRVEPVTEHRASSVQPRFRQQVTVTTGDTTLNVAATDTPNLIDASPSVTPIDPALHAAPVAKT